MSGLKFFGNMQSFPNAANVSLMFGSMRLEDRIDKAKKLGFKSVEAWWPFSSPKPRRAEIDKFLHIVDRARVQLICMNLYGGSPFLGEAGVGFDRTRHSDVLESTEAVRLVHEATGCRLFNLPMGIPPNRNDEVFSAASWLLS